ncbi:hypothetical protein RHSIM_Rhsim03G0156600 [Rhododendron simsii]|uniref:Nucleotide-diphospho-sugar transferase domain-containing protein n=1 Tax=Rhododendron simsii TaxID=118357 RepID=A0A834H9Q2_RHOSS|nr:hypothetical protein RHSIM_Rhsim03G0156600 [Rhododendron simsii]
MRSSSTTVEYNQMTSSTTKNRAFDFTILSLLLLGVLFIFIATPSGLKPLLSNPRPQCNCSTMYEMVVYQDELDEVLAETSMENKTVIIAVVNKAYVEGEKSMLDLFLDGFWIGDDTQGLVNHILIVTTDPVSYNRCKFLRLHCYKLETEGVDFAGEQMFMSEDYVKMMWRRTLFLGDVLKRGYNFIFTVRLFGCMEIRLCLDTFMRIYNSMYTRPGREERLGKQTKSNDDDHHQIDPLPVRVERRAIILLLLRVAGAVRGGGAEAVFELLSMAAALAVAVPATLVTSISVLVLLAFCGKLQQALVVEGKELTAEITGSCSRS